MTAQENPEIQPTDDTSGAAPQPLDPWFLDLLACPSCPEHLSLTLNAAQDALHCGCGRYAFPIRDGIPILLTDEAELLDPIAEPGQLKKP